MLHSSPTPSTGRVVRDARLDALLDRLHAYAAPRLGRLIAQPRFEAGAYTRLLVDRDVHREVWLLAWSAGQASTIHDHAQQPTATLVLRGQLEEEAYVQVGATVRAVGRRTRGAGDADVDDGHAIHRVTCTSAQAITLHAFAPCYVAGMVFAEPRP